MLIFAVVTILEDFGSLLPARTVTVQSILKPDFVYSRVSSYANSIQADAATAMINLNYFKIFSLNEYYLIFKLKVLLKNFIWVITFLILSFKTYTITSVIIY